MSEYDTEADFSFVLRYWRGEYPLSMCYWFVWLLIQPLLGNFLKLVMESTSSKLVSLAALLCISLWVTYVSVGLWRSATAYKIEKPKNGLWSAMAKGYAMVGPIIMATVWWERIG